MGNLFFNKYVFLVGAPLRESKIELGVPLPLDKLGVGSAVLPVSAFGLGLPATKALRAVVRQHLRSSAASSPA